MLVIKQNGRSKLGRTGNGIHMETNKNMETLNAVWLTAELARWRSVHMAVLILSVLVPLSPFIPFQKSLSQGVAVIQGKGHKVNSWRGIWNLS